MSGPRGQKGEKVTLHQKFLNMHTCTFLQGELGPRGLMGLQVRHIHRARRCTGTISLCS